jgi:HlyD family secretion protein
MTGANRRTDEGGAVRARVAAAVGVVVVALGLVARATVADTSSGGSYRTATAAKATVLQTLTRAGTIEPVAQATIAFPVAGTVATVAVRVGDTLATGQELASLDTTALTGELATKQAALATAQSTLDQAVAGQSASAASSSAAASTGGTARSSGNGTASHELASTQQQVLDGQRQVDAATTAAKAALDAAAAACTGPGPDTAAGGVTATTLPTTEPRTDARAAAVAAATPAPPQTGLGSAACMTAQQRVLTSQQSLADALHGLSQVESSLDEVLSRAADTAAAAASTGSSSSGSSSSGSPSGGSSASSPASSNAGSAGRQQTSTAPSAAQLVADQAAVDAADAAVSVAQQSIDQATVVSPIAGTVGAVTLVPGQQVTAGSSVADVVVVGQGGSEVATTVSVDDVDKVRIGQTATVVPDGTSTSLDARVVSVGVAGSTSGTTTYPVVVGFTGSPAGLGNGASASVRIELARAVDVLTVPTSAVHTTGTVKTVEVPAGTSTRAVPVQVGTVGPDRTEVTSGLAAGQTVVLADLSRPLPASNTTNTGGGLGGLGGGGIGGGGARTGVRGPG